MAMLTPIPLLRPIPLEPIALLQNSFRNFSGLRPTLGTALRITADIGSIWAAFLFGWLIVGGNDLAALTAGEGARIIPLIGLLSTLALVTYIAAGLYTHTHSYRLAAKIRRVAAVSVTLFVVGVALQIMTVPPTGLSLYVLATTIVGSFVLLSLARVGSAVLRMEDWRGDGQYEESDENKVLVIGGAGYIGSALVEKLLNLGLKVSVLDAMHFGEETLKNVAGHPNLTLIREDFRHIEALTRAMNGVGSVIHLGGLVGDPACAVDCDLTVDVNVTATKVIGEIAKARGVRRFIFAKLLLGLWCKRRNRQRNFSL
jgi:FlaA1/EpsC-like NDP-sugar epimerase